MESSFLRHVSGDYISVHGNRGMELTARPVFAVCFSSANLGKERQDDFHKNTLKAAIQEYGEKNLYWA